MSEENLEKRYFVKENNIYILNELYEQFHLIFPSVIELIQSKPKEINIYIDTIGGDLNLAFAFTSLMQEYQRNGGKVNTHIIGRCNSSGVVISIIGNFRTMTKFSDFIIHYGEDTYNMKSYGETKQVLKNIKYKNIVLKKHLERYTNLPKKILNKIFDNGDRIFITDEEAIKYRIIDMVI